MSNSSPTLSYKEALSQSMREALYARPHSILMGQGVTDPTRIFGTTHGLVEEFGPARVLDLPIAEEGTTGFAIGAALNGVYPISVHIRMDFLVLAMNQIVNLAAKYRYMYGGRFEVPLLIRAVVGRSWGQGPQHSQSLQSLFAHIPGLVVLMPSNANDVLNSYRYAIQEYRSPVLSIEHRFLYDLVFKKEDPSTPNRNPFSARTVQEGKDVTIVATSYMVQEAQKAAVWVLEEKGIQCEIIDLHCVSQVDHELIFKSVQKTRKLIIADTSWSPYGVCAEVSRGILERNPSVLKYPALSLGLQHTPTPTSHALEKHYYPDMGNIVDAVYQATQNQKVHGFDLPSEDFKKNQRIKFKGPF